MKGLYRLHGEPRPLASERLEQPAPDAAVALLGALLVRDEPDGSRTIARLVETEAYREDDPASHSFARRTSRVEPMFQRPGTAYVYRSYGVHWCVNVSVEEKEVGAAVLLRAAALLQGTAEVAARRAHVADRSRWLRGPGNLAQALDVDGPRHTGIDLLDPLAGFWLADDGWRPPEGRVRRGPRVGVSLAAEVPWRFHLDVPEVSPYRRSPRAPRGTAETHP